VRKRERGRDFIGRERGGGRESQRRWRDASSELEKKREKKRIKECFILIT